MNIYGYKTFYNNEEFREWQLNNSKYYIVSVTPIQIGVHTTCGGVDGYIERIAVVYFEVLKEQPDYVI